MCQAFAHLRYVSLLNLACISASFVVIDGPLLQKASTVVRATELRPVTMDLRLVPELPNGFSSIVKDGTI